MTPSWRWSRAASPSNCIDTARGSAPTLRTERAAPRTADTLRSMDPEPAVSSIAVLVIGLIVAIVGALCLVVFVAQPQADRSHRRQLLGDGRRQDRRPRTRPERRHPAVATDLRLRASARVTPSAGRLRTTTTPATARRSVTTAPSRTTRPTPVSSRWALHRRAISASSSGSRSPRSEPRRSSPGPSAERAPPIRHGPPPFGHRVAAASRRRGPRR